LSSGFAILMSRNQGFGSGFIAAESGSRFTEAESGSRIIQAESGSRFTEAESGLRFFGGDQDADPGFDDQKLGDRKKFQSIFSVE
jgi:hypothetical protein